MTEKPQLKFLDAALYAVIMNTGLRWLPVAAAVGPASFSLWTLALITFFVPLAAATAQLTERFAAEGGIYAWVRETYGPLAGFLCGWVYWFSLMPYFAGILYFLSGLAMAALGLDPHDKTLYLIFSVALGTFVTAFQFVGLAFNKWLTNFGAAGSWLIFALLAALALYFLAHHQSATNFATSSYLPKLDFNTAILWGTIVFAYSGLEAVGFLRNEIAGGMKTVLRVLAVVGVAVGVLYIVGTGAMLVLLPPSQMSRLGGFSDVLNAVFRHASLPTLAPLALGALALAQLGGFTAWFGAGARLPLAAGIDHFLPAAFGKRNAHTGAPVAAILLQGGLMLVFVVLGQAGNTAAVAYDFLVSMSVLTNSICYVFMFAAYFNLSRGAQVPGAWLPPGGARTSMVLAVLGQAATLIAIACTLVPGADDAHPLATFLKIALSSIVMLVAGLVLYWLGSRRRAAALEGALS
ncbi:MAG TPA: APC family permease [Rhizomicrobium sp.]|jgi:amino acid transporter|nr:APC family permease [Rhizomicrobium sp.]